MERYIEIERSIVKKFRKPIWNKFIAAIKEYNLIEKNDCIAVCISGGKDSMLMAKCLERLQGYSEIPFTVKYIVLNSGYNEKNLELIKKNCQILNISPQIFEANIFNYVKSQGGSPCYLCARMRRGHLYGKAEELGCNKIALGHHFDDVIETTLLSMFYGAEVKTMMPKLHSDNFKGLELIRPLYLVKETAIKAWRDYNGLSFINCACPLLEKCSIEENDEDIGRRQAMKNLINSLRKERKNIDNNIFTALNNINMNCILGYKKDGKYTSFLDEYEEDKK